MKMKKPNALVVEEEEQHWNIQKEQVVILVLMMMVDSIEELVIDVKVEDIFGLRNVKIAENH